MSQNGFNNNFLRLRDCRILFQTTHCQWFPNQLISTPHCKIQFHTSCILWDMAKGCCDGFWSCALLTPIFWKPLKVITYKSSKWRVYFFVISYTWFARSKGKHNKQAKAIRGSILVESEVKRNYYSCKICHNSGMFKIFWVKNYWVKSIKTKVLFGLCFYWK